MPSAQVTVVGGERLTGELLALSLRRSGRLDASWQAGTEIDQDSVAVVLDPAPAVLRAIADQGGRAVAMVTGTPVSASDAIGLVIGGADAVLSAEMPTEDMVRQIETVQRGGAVVPADRLRTLLDQVRRSRGTRVTSADDLTQRERQILQSIDRGESVKQTARALGISPKTVENLQSRLFSKLDVRNRAQAISHAHDLSLLDESADTDADADGTGGLPT